MRRLFVVVAITAMALISGAEAKRLPGEPLGGMLNGPSDCLVIAVSPKMCSSGRIEVCGAPNRSSDRSRTCVAGAKQATPVFLERDNRRAKRKN